ncbi:T7SS effector LXG polymorphic toxin [Listeria booriae]|uniref:T7SS effector LXG polymorphic toxin n=1 Tax=Listeria booriae TaxID=1552123 RepID=UPI001628ACB8|nr:T7SS effector LXG polymorphic toxin [Listeria booriae]MBC2319669.1 hypothetical protein [Listeria booriae]
MKIDVRELREFVSDHITALTKEHETLHDAMTATTTFTTETQEFFKGKTADASRAYLQEAYQPVQQKTLEVNELMTKTLDAYIADAEAQFGANGIVDIPAIEMEYKRNLNQFTDYERQEYRELNEFIQEANEFISFPTSNLSLVEELHHDALAEITKVRMKLEDFETKWNTEFNKVETLQTELDHMLAQVGNNTITPTSYQAGMIKFMNAEQQALYDKLPPEFKDAITSGFATIDDFQSTNDGFIVCTKPLGTEEYADWYTYCIKDENGDFVFGVCKLRSNLNAKSGIGIAISFIEVLPSDLNLIFSKQKTGNEFDSEENSSIYKAIYGLGEGNPALLNYFSDSNSKAPYLIADLYVKKIVDSNIKDGIISTQDLSALEDYQLEQLEALGCYKDGKLYILDKDNLTEAEYRLILLCYSANTSIYSFAAEVQAHATGTGFAEDPWKSNATSALVGLGAGALFPPLAILSGTIGFYGTKYGLGEVQKSGVKSDSGVGEAGDSAPSKKVMEEAFGREDSYLTKEQRELHESEEKKKHGW